MTDAAVILWLDNKIVLKRKQHARPLGIGWMSFNRRSKLRSVRPEGDFDKQGQGGQNNDGILLVRQTTF